MNKQDYFAKPEYKWLYLSQFFFAFANSFMELFGVVMLYKNGMPLYTILFIYGLRFGIMGIGSPLFLKVSAKSGIATCAILADLLRIATIYMVQNGAQNNLLLFLLATSLAGALQNPIQDAISSRYVDTHHRGRYNSMRSIALILGQALASIFVAWGVVTQNNTLLLLVISMFFLLEYLCIAVVDYRSEITNTDVFKETLTHIFKNLNRYELIYAFRTSYVIERLFVPLYLYLVLQDFVAFSTVLVVSLCIQIVTVILIGKLTDKNPCKTIHFVTAIRAIITLIYLFIRNKLAIAFNKTLSDNFQKVYETTLRTSTQNMIKKAKQDNSVLSTVGQMCLCFTELVVFLVLAFICYFIEEQVFYVIFLLSIVSSLSIDWLITKEDQR